MMHATHEYRAVIIEHLLASWWEKKEKTRRREKRKEKKIRAFARPNELHAFPALHAFLAFQYSIPTP